METRKIRTPSARMLAAKEDECGLPLPKSLLPPQLTKSSDLELSQLARQLVQAQTTPTSSRAARLESLQKPPSPTMEDEIDVSAELEQHPIEEQEIEVEEEEEIVEEIEEEVVHEEMELIQKQEKIAEEEMVLNGQFSVANEVTISSMKYQGRPSNSSQHFALQPSSRTTTSAGFTGESLSLKNSDLTLPNKAAHFLYFRCYEDHEVQKEFPLTIDETRKGPQNFLVEPRVGLKNTDYYIDSYLWNRGKSTSSKKKIYVGIENNHVKTSRKQSEDSHFVLNWYYSNMENRICKKVCWLETVPNCIRSSPVLVQYIVNYLSDTPIELRKTPKLYSDTRSVAQELLRSDSPLQTVARFVETGETDPREVINKKQVGQEAYEMRRYVMANARKRTQRKFEDLYFDEDMFEEVQYYGDHNHHHHGDPMGYRAHAHNQSDVGRVANMAVRLEGRKIENRIARMLDARLPGKQHEAVSEWLQTLESTNPEDVALIVPDLITSMRKHLDELMGEQNAASSSDFMDHHSHHQQHHEEQGVRGSQNANKRMKMMVGEDEEVVDHVVEEVDTDGNLLSRRTTTGTGERFIFDGQEYVEEEVITEEIEVVPRGNGAGDDVVTNGEDVGGGAGAREDVGEQEEEEEEVGEDVYRDLPHQEEVVGVEEEEQEPRQQI
ncbi:hypothetical protein L3Y34_005535 [Caenorhabditis briggsae]|uniref:Uncharacterized protein n=1 Tax=Caenorhabditis briggsae TaxID=6238 RepID=A0AAE9ACJ1_CAEBR|nr:hypothetical protein L3Y34_005535 [Caenorhabditis briggsae]